MYRLVFINGKRKGRRLRIDGKRATIGSDSACTVSTPDSSLQGIQAELVDSESGVYLKKLDQNGSININGDEVEQAVLHDGDIFSVGPLSFKFQASGSSSIYGRRKGDALQIITLTAVLAVLLVEIILLFGWTIYLTIDPSLDSKPENPSPSSAIIDDSSAQPVQAPDTDPGNG